MSKSEKLLLRFRSNPPPVDFRWDELKTMLGRFGFVLEETGGGSSHKTFVLSSNPVRMIYTHRPHPGGILKSYQIREIREQLVLWGMINHE